MNQLSSWVESLDMRVALQHNSALAEFRYVLSVDLL